MPEANNYISGAQIKIQSKLATYIKHLDDVQNGRSVYNSEEIDLFSDFDINNDGNIDNKETDTLKSKLNSYRDNIVQYFDEYGRKINKDFDLNGDKKISTKEILGLNMVLDSKKLSTIQIQTQEIAMNQAEINVKKSRLASPPTYTVKEGKTTRTRVDPIEVNRLTAELQKAETKLALIKEKIQLGDKFETVQRLKNINVQLANATSLTDTLQAQMMVLETQMNSLIKTDPDNESVKEMTALLRTQISNTRAALGFWGGEASFWKNELQESKTALKESNTLSKAGQSINTKTNLESMREEEQNAKSLAELAKKLAAAAKARAEVARAAGNNSMTSGAAQQTMGQVQVAMGQIQVAMEQLGLIMGSASTMYGDMKDYLQTKESNKKVMPPPIDKNSLTSRTDIFTS